MHNLLFGVGPFSGVLHGRQHPAAPPCCSCLLTSREASPSANCAHSSLQSLCSRQLASSRHSLRPCGVREQTVLDFTPLSNRVPLFTCVEDVMTKSDIHTVTPETTVDEALEMLVSQHVTGLPVVDESEQVVGVVSDFDMLSLDGISGKMRATGMFPDTSTEWSAFFEVQKLLTKNQGKKVADVMTSDPMVVRGNTDLEAAARLLLERRIRRMPVVDSQGRLIGVFSRGDVIRAALVQRKAAVEAGLQSHDQGE